MNTLITSIVIGIPLALMLYLIIFRPKADSAIGFFLHNEKLQLNPYIATMISSNLSLGNMVFICAILGYWYGWSGVFWVVITIICLGLGFICFGEKFKAYITEKGNFGTVNDYIANTHQTNQNDNIKPLKTTAGLVSAISLTIAIILETHIGTLIMANISGIDQIILVAVFLAIAVTYSAYAGFYNVVWTDIFQFIFMLIAMLAGIYFFWSLPDGITFTELEYTPVNIMATGWPTAIGLVVLGFLWLIATPDTWQRNCASRNMGTSRNGILIGVAIMCLFVALFAMGGMWARADLEPLVIAAGNEALLSGGNYVFSDIFLLPSESLSLLTNISLIAIAIGLLMAAVSSIDTYLITFSHITNVDIIYGCKANTIRSFRDINEQNLDASLLSNGRYVMIASGFLLFLGWWAMNYQGWLDNPLSLFFVIYTMQFSHAIPIIAGSWAKTRSLNLTALFIGLSATITVIVGILTMQYYDSPNVILGFTPAEWQALLPLVPVVICCIGYSILFGKRTIGA